MPSTRQHWQAGFLFALATAALWGMSPLMLKELLPILGATTVAWCRLVISAAVVGAYFIARNDVHWRILLVPKNALLLLIAIAGLLGNYIAFMIGLKHITPGAAQVLAQLAPLSLLVGGVLVFREPFSPLQWFGIALTVVGLPLFFHLHLDGLQHLDSFGIGLLWIAGASLLWGMFGIAQKALSQSVGSQQVLLVIYCTGTIVFLPNVELVRIPQMHILMVAILIWASVSMVLSYVTLAAAMTRWDASRVSAILTTTPLFTLTYVAIAAHWIPNYGSADALDLLSWLGAALVVIGSGTAAIARR